MLRVKRASAGSGKTYQLAKTYIKLLITTKSQGHKRLMMKDESFREALSSIMAVTFTVKATAEMKQRIVEKLADLARADKADEEERKEIDYLQEFIDDFRSNPYEIADLARRALRTLLLHYSDFRVQTIDSFFQGILHTFAYEASLDDNFNMEVDTDFVTAQGFSSTLDSLSENTAEPRRRDQTLHWLRQLMDGEVTKRRRWNVFARHGTENSLHGKLLKEAGNLEKEDFKTIREELTDYFDALERPFHEVVEEVERANTEQFRACHERRRAAARRLVAALAAAGLTEDDIYFKRGADLRAALKDFNPTEPDLPTKDYARGAGDSLFSLSGDAQKVMKKRMKIDPSVAGLTAEIDAAFDEWFEANHEYTELDKEGWNTWKAYRSMLPSLMMVLEIAREKEAFLRSTNTLQISDTNTILASIIDKDDTPFIYERTGTRLNHYLIDEFQDTSAMQWANLKPLLDESEATDNENLIIGDAKQSIYRFRNADHTIITGLERQFGNVVHYTGENEPKDKTKENTNFRSKRRVVEFNNHVFSHLPAMQEDTFSDTARTVYSDCVQAIPGKRFEEPAQGYVEMVFYRKRKAEAGSDDDTQDDAELQPGFAELPARILDMRARGYRFRDIGILVKSHKQGKAAVGVIGKYNRANPGNPIPVISEEDLLVSSALSVRLIIHALETAAKGAPYRTKENPVVSDPVDVKELTDLLRSLQSLSLPSVVEAVIDRFVPRGRRDAEAPFIAAFQDMVIDYSASHSSDIGSFLKWWKLKGATMSITSPEDSDGVRLMTIHKAKGLEYKCVIIPCGDFSFVPDPKKLEWRWEAPAEAVRKREPLPPYLPVETKTELLQTAHRDDYKKYLDEFALDELNKMYVAFTRAAHELYVYLPVASGKGGATKASGLLMRLFGEEAPEETFLSEATVTESRGGEYEDTVISYGSTATREQVEEERRRKAEKAMGKSSPAPETLALERYDVSADRDSLRLQDGNPLKTIVHPDGRVEEIDPRAEGSLKHRVMQMVERPADLDKALRMMRVEGLVSKSRMEEWGRQLREAIDSVADRGWFAPDVTVLNERAVVESGRRSRPDRIVVTPDNDAIVIDYKFGVPEPDNKKQVREYVDLLKRSRRFRTVRGYLWYVASGDIVGV